MARIICLTGGIGSGKSTVARIFESNGVPVYYADDAGRKILEKPNIVSKVIELFGPEVLTGDRIDRRKLAEIVFNDSVSLRSLNKIVHPAVAEDFRDWLDHNATSEFVLRETAILFESGTEGLCDIIVTVSAPAEVRMNRVMQRDKITREDVKRRIDNQWTDAEREIRSDFVIVNDSIDELPHLVSKILKKLQNL